MSDRQSQNDRPEVLVVGAGVAGLSAAWLLARKGWPVRVWDAADGPGGLLRPVDFRSGRFDRGSHRIHPEAHPLLREITSEEQWVEQPRRGRLVLGGRTMAYPPQVGDFLRGLGGRTVAHMGMNFVFRRNALAGFRRWEEDRATVDEDVGFASFVTGRVGQRAYQQFYAPYVEKVWGLDPNEISQTVAKARVSTASPWVTLAKAVRPGPVIDRVFLYPSGGMVRVVENLLEKLENAGVTVEFGKQFTMDDAGDHAGPILYSGHLSHIAPDAGLDHRGLYLLHIALPKGTVGETDTFYLPETQFWFGRVSQPAQFASDLAEADADVVCVEIPEGRWGTEHDFTSDLDPIHDQLATAGIIPGSTRILEATQTFVPRVYPMYRRGWTTRWRKALDTVSTAANIFPIGRQGLFLHCNIDHCVHISDEAVKHLDAGGSAADWVGRANEFLDLRVRD